MKKALFALAAVVLAVLVWLFLSGRSIDRSSPLIVHQANNEQFSSDQKKTPRESLPTPPPVRPNRETVAGPRPRGERPPSDEDPEIREYGMRQTMRDWAPFFMAEDLSLQQEELLVQLLVDWVIARDLKERGAIDALIAEILTDDQFKRMIVFRDDLPVKAAVKEATNKMAQNASILLDATSRQVIEEVIRSAPLNHDPIWKDASESLEAGRLAHHDLPKIEALARQKFELSLQQNATGLSEAQRAALRRWFEQGPLAFNMRALTNALRARE